MKTSAYITFIEMVLAEPSTTVEYKETTYKSGFYIKNHSWNCQINVFSDIGKGYYFEFKNIEFNQQNDKEILTPIYRTEDDIEVLPLLRKIVTYTEFKENSSIPNSSTYIELFHKILRDEPLPEPYKVEITDRKIHLTSSHLNHSMFISQQDIHQFERESQSILEPTSSLTLRVQNINKVGKAAYMFIPKAFFSEYKLLNTGNKIKNPDLLITSPDDWLSNIRSIANSTSPKVNSALDYINLNEKMESKKNTDSSSKIRPKL